MSLQIYILRRAAFLIPVCVGVSIITFVLSHVIPGDPARLASGLEAHEEQVQALRMELGLDQSIPVQYGMYVSRLVQGDLGVSIINHRPIWDNLKIFFPATLELSLASLFLSLLVGIPLGVLSALYKDAMWDHLSRVGALLGIAFPVFWVGIVLLLVFYYKLDWFPSGGRVDTHLVLREPVPTMTGLLTMDALLARNWLVLGSALWHLTLPAISLSLSTLARIARMTRTAMVEVLNEPYITTARSMGLRERRVLYAHALRNAMIPTTTIVGISFGYLLGGSVLVETIFAWPGLGKYAFESIIYMDFPAIMGVTLLATLVFLSTNLIVDICYMVLDPRIRYE